MDKVAICNMAIGWCGGNLIMDFTDDSVEADLVRVAYEPTRDLVLEQRDWTFAASRAVLVPLAEVPAFGFSTKSQLPTDLLVVREVTDDPISMRKIDYVKEQRTLLTNTTDVYIKYTIRVVNEELFSPSFVYALAHKIAAVIAIPLTESVSLKKDMETLAQAYIEEGGSIDGTQTKVGRAYASRIVGARLRGGGGYYGTI